GRHCRRHFFPLSHRRVARTIADLIIAVRRMGTLRYRLDDHSLARQQHSPEAAIRRKSLTKTLISFAATRQTTGGTTRHDRSLTCCVIYAHSYSWFVKICLWSLSQSFINDTTIRL